MIEPAPPRAYYGNSTMSRLTKIISRRLQHNSLPDYGEKADFLFIDGDHTEPGVEADYNDYKEFVRPGGLIAFHDIIENQPLEINQVYHLWKRIKPGAEVLEFVADPNQCGFGIGVIKVPA
jgi:hypothetical protein